MTSSSASSSPLLPPLPLPLLLHLLSALPPSPSLDQKLGRISNGKILKAEVEGAILSSAPVFL